MTTEVLRPSSTVGDGDIITVGHRPEPIAALTGLRFVAAFSVLIAHATGLLVAFEPPWTFTEYLSFGPALGMPLFFVLSGFVIHYNYGRSFLTEFVGPSVDFFIARFSRLYPLYLAALILYLATHSMVQPMLENADTSFLLRYLLLWQAWGLDYRGTTWFGALALPPAWSISVEVFFYALYPCLALPLLRIRKAWMAALTLAVITVGFYTAIALCYRNFDALRVWGNATFFIDADPQNALLGWLLNTGPVGRFWEFLMGAVVAQGYLLQRDRSLGPVETRFGPALVLLITLVIALFYWLAHRISFIWFFGAYPGGFAPLFALLIFGCSRYRSPISRMLAARGMVALGNASYSIYLLHLFTLSLVRQPTPWVPTRSNIVAWAITMTVGIGMTLVVSLGTYRVLELPARNALRRTLNLGKNSLHLEALLQLMPAWVGPTLCVVMIAGGVGAWNWPRTPIINIVEANFGEHCASVVLETPYVNGFHKGNATLFVRQHIYQHCLGQRSCTYTIGTYNIPEAVHGCINNFSAIYRCAGDGATRSIVVPDNAYLKTVAFDCN